MICWSFWFWAVIPVDQCLGNFLGTLWSHQSLLRTPSGLMGGVCTVSSCHQDFIFAGRNFSDTSQGGSVVVQCWPKRSSNSVSFLAGVKFLLQDCCINESDFNSEGWLWVYRGLFTLLSQFEEISFPSSESEEISPSFYLPRISLSSFWYALSLLESYVSALV